MGKNHRTQQVFVGTLIFATFVWLAYQYIISGIYGVPPTSGLSWSHIFSSATEAERQPAKDIATLLGSSTVLLALVGLGLRSGESDLQFTSTMLLPSLAAGWHLAYYLPSAHLYVHVGLAIAIGVAVLMLIHGSVVVSRRLGPSAEVLVNMLLNVLVLVPALLVLHIAPYSTHAALATTGWTWGASLPWIGLVLWVGGQIVVALFLLVNANMRMWCLLLSVTIITAVAIALVEPPATPVRAVSLDELVAAIQAGRGKGLVIAEGQIALQTNGERLVAVKEAGRSGLDILRDLGITPPQITRLRIEVAAPGVLGVSSVALTWLGVVLLAILMINSWLFLTRQNQRSNSQDFQTVLKTLARLFQPRKVRITFDDVIGQEEAKKDLLAIVEYLTNPDRFDAYNAHAPRGILLSGPPGTGKTLLARATANVAGRPFLFISGSEFVELFAGVGASRVRHTFAMARHQAPCIVFIDEIDAVGRQRGAGMSGAHDERDQTLNQILVELDGLDTSPGVVVIAATNRPDILDPALVRSGRFDKRVGLVLPNHQERIDLLKLHADNKPLLAEPTAENLSEEIVDFDALARLTSGMSGADLATIANESAMLAALETPAPPAITQRHFRAAARKVGIVIPELPPAEQLHGEIDQVVGQAAAKAALIEAVRGHYADIRARDDFDGRYRFKPNVLLYGPTGTGKSLLVRTLADALHIPHASIDASLLADNTLNIRIALHRLLSSASNNARRAEFGIICIYGIETLLDSRAAGVQEELARIIEGTRFDVPQDEYSAYSRTVPLDTTYMLFIAEGTFAKQRNMLHHRLREHSARNGAPSNGARPNSATFADMYADLVEHGFTHRLLDRFPVLASTEPLLEEQLQIILARDDGSLIGRPSTDHDAASLTEDERGTVIREVIARGGDVRLLRPIVQEAQRRVRQASVQLESNKEAS